MPETQTVTVNAYHPYPEFYWEFKLAGGVAADIEGYDAYQSGQGTKTVGINATINEVGSIRCTVGPESAGTPVYGQAGTVTTDEIPVTVGQLTWELNPTGKPVTIQTAPIVDTAVFGPVDTTLPLTTSLAWDWSANGEAPWTDVLAEFTDGATLTNTGGIADDTLTIPHALIAQSGYIRCTATDSEGAPPIETTGRLYVVGAE